MAKNIVILGAGFGGVKAARTLAKKINKYGLMQKYEVILVDRNEYHTYVPILYEAASTSKETANYLDLKKIVTFPVHEVIKGLPITFRRGEVKHIDLKKKAVRIASSQNEEVLSYDYLVIALGSETNDFGMEGIAQYGLYLKSFVDALRVRDTIISKIEAAPEKLNIVIGGAGATGVELAAEIQEWTAELRNEKRGECQICVTMIEGASKILGPLDPQIIAHVTKRLRKLGIRIITNEFIARVDAKQIYLKSGKTVSYDVLIWTGGIKAPDLLKDLPLKLERGSRVAVENSLKCVSADPELNITDSVYGVGDSVCFHDPKTGGPVPYLAHAAIVEGQVAGKNIIEDIKYAEKITDAKKHVPYVPMNYPYIIAAGGKWAAVKIGPLRFYGFFGWLLKGVVELKYLFSILGPVRAFKIWIKGLFIFMANDRLG